MIAHVLDVYSVLAKEVESGHPERLAIADLLPSLDDTPDVGSEVDLMGVSDKDWKEANRRFEIIRPLLTEEGRDRDVVEERARESGVHWTTLYRWV
ncbi:MAG: transposase, partial [Gemmatimonadetes bacterium]|nr:transposase [Gemmatimonadota bacterium]